jgi:hypothetical protein
MLRLVPGPGETVAAALLEPVGVTLRVDSGNDERFAVQLWTNLPSLAAWPWEPPPGADATAGPGGGSGAGGGGPAWHAETATPGNAENRIAVIPLCTGECGALAAWRGRVWA